MRRAFEKVVEFNATFAQRIETSRLTRATSRSTRNTRAERWRFPAAITPPLQQERRLTEDMKLFERADTIIRVLHEGLASDVQFWRTR